MGGFIGSRRCRFTLHITSYIQISGAADVIAHFHYRDQLLSITTTPARPYCVTTSGHLAISNLHGETAGNHQPQTDLDTGLAPSGYLAFPCDAAEAFPARLLLDAPRHGTSLLQPARTQSS